MKKFQVRITKCDTKIGSEQTPLGEMEPIGFSDAGLTQTFNL